MGLRRTAVAAVLTAGAALTFTGVASAQQDRDCPDFASQADAQAAFAARPGDPERLDADNDGIACESYFGEPVRATPSSSGDQQVGIRPQGGVSTGDASTVADLGAPPAPIAVAAPRPVAAPSVITSPARH
jgi:hypothetical protein